MPLFTDGLGGLSSLVAPVTITTTETVAHQFKIPANDVQIGTRFRLTAFGTVSATTAGTVLARLRLGALGTIADVQVAATAAAGAATAAVGWTVTFSMTVATIGSAGTVYGNGILIVNAATAQVSPQVALVAMNTTAPNFLSLTLIGGGTAPSVVCREAGVELVKP